MESSEWDLGYLLSIGYALPLNTDCDIIGTLRWNNIAEQQISAASFQAQLGSDYIEHPDIVFLPENIVS